MGGALREHHFPLREKTLYTLFKQRRTEQFFAAFGVYDKKYFHNTLYYNKLTPRKRTTPRI
jgi:hypothetical protein